MKFAKIVAAACLSTLSLTACGNAPSPPAPPSPPDPPQTILGQAVGKAMDKARAEMASGNLTLGRGGGISINGSRIGEGDQPKAEITPQGDFLVEGRAIAVNDRQRALLLEYRKQVLGIAEAGMSMGTKGADLAGNAIKEAIGGILSGESQQIEQRIEAKAKKLETEAKEICTQLDPLLATQAKLAAGLPEFKPYATLTQSDVDDCRKHDGAAVIAGGGTRSELQADIRDGIRSSIRTAVQGTTAAMGAGSTASVDGVRFLVPAGSLSVASSNGSSTLDAGGLEVRLEGDGMWVDGKRYARPAKGSEVDLRTTGTVKVDGAAVTAN